MLVLPRLSLHLEKEKVICEGETEKGINSFPTNDEI